MMLAISIICFVFVYTLTRMYIYMQHEVGYQQYVFCVRVHTYIQHDVMFNTIATENVDEYVYVSVDAKT